MLCIFGSVDFVLPISDSCISIMLSIMFLLMKAVSLIAAEVEPEDEVVVDDLCARVIVDVPMITEAVTIRRGK